MAPEELRGIIKRLPETRIGFLGDICLDLYWYADMRRSVLSLETTHFPLPVVREEMSPGAGGNVVQNIQALGVGAVYPLSVIGPDWRGGLLKDRMKAQGVPTDRLILDDSRVTPCYCKPVRMGYQGIFEEDSRLDFENTQVLSGNTEGKVIAALDSMAPLVDVLAVSDQFEHGVMTPNIRRHLAFLGGQGMTVVVDSRCHVSEYSRVILKPNQLEALRCLDIRETEEEMTVEDFGPVARRIFSFSLRPVVITLGEAGALFYDGTDLTHVPAKPVRGPLDIVGAGDTFLAAFTAALAAGAPGITAVAFANLASGVTVKKLRTTGTATPQEITGWFEEKTV